VKQYVHTLVYEHRHGRDMSVFASSDAANLARAVIVMNNLHEIDDPEVRTSIEKAYEDDRFDQCYNLYQEAVEDESMTIEDCHLQGAEVTCRVVVVDDDGVAHRAALLPFANVPGMLMCVRRFYLTCSHAPESEDIHVHMPKDVPTVTCLGCIAAESYEAAPHL